MAAFARETERVEALFGISKSGIEMRLKLTPRAGGALDGASNTLGARALEFKEVSGRTVFALVGAPIAPKGKLGAAWRAFTQDAGKMLTMKTGDGYSVAMMMDEDCPEVKAGELAAEFKRTVSESATVKSPMFAARWMIGTGDGSAAGSIWMPAWGFGWRKGNDYRALFRVSTESLAKVFSAMLMMESDDD